MPQSLAITSSSHTNGAGKNRHPFASDIGRSSDGDRSQTWEAGQQGDARIGNPRALPELDLFERQHAPQYLRAAVGDPGLAGLTLPPLEAAGFLLHRERPAVAGLTLAPQAFNLSVCPTARSILIPSSLMFFAAL